MATIANLLVKLGADSSGLASGLSKAEAAVGKFSKGVGTVAKTAVKTTATIGAAFATASVAIGTASVNAFADFEQGMNEVFTLLPGITDKAMGEMEDSVKKFSKEFGVLPDQAIPSLYSALSAGVPEDNVFAFIETAQKLAKGGITDVETAVDGLSSVVNAYGDDVLSAQKASDLMFQAIKYGKTTAGELAGSLYNVIPTASSLGVKFEDVTAAIAQMTAMGTPTSVATTQMRQMLVELSKAGTKTSDSFEQMAGKSFVDFVNEGGNVQQALAILQKGADESGLRMSDMFGSVEAGNAALALSGANAETYTDLINKMGDSAGATDEAYAQMDKGIIASLNRIKSAAQVALIDLGDTLAPHAESAITGFLAILSGEEGGVEQLTEGVNGLMTTFMDTAVAAIPQLIESGISIVGAFVEGVLSNTEAINSAISMLMEGFVALIIEYAPSAVMAFYELVMTVVDTVINSAPALFDAAVGLLMSLMEGLVSDMPSLIENILTVVSTMLDTIIENLPAFVDMAGQIIVSIITGLAEKAPTLIPKMIEVLLIMADAILNNLGLILTAAIQVIVAVVQGLVKALPKLIEWLPKIVNTIIKVIIDNLPMLIDAAVKIVTAVVKGLIQNLPMLVQAAIQLIFALIGGLIQAIPQIVSAMPRIAKAVVNGFKNINWGQVGKDMINGIKNGVTNAAKGLASAAKNAASSALSAVKGFLGIRSPSKVMEQQVGKNMSLGIAQGIDKYSSDIDKAMNSAIPDAEVKSTVKMEPISATPRVYENREAETANLAAVIYTAIVEAMKQNKADEEENLRDLLQAIRDIRLRGAVQIDGRDVGEILLDPLLDNARLRRKEWPVVGRA